MNIWEEEAKINLLPLSRDAKNLDVALKEWVYSGTSFDLGEPCEDCRLCGYNPIRYQFEIKNVYTNNKLLIGSECITKFGISVTDGENGRILDGAEALEKVSRDKQKLIEESSLNRVLSVLMELAFKENFFRDKIGSFVDYYLENKGFTPKQLLLIIRGLTRHNIQHRKNDFRVKLKRNREKYQLSSMPTNDFSVIFPCLTASQKNKYSRF